MYYKMKTILLFVLSAIILSQGYGFAHGAEDIVTVTTDSSSYEEGDVINIQGFVSDYRESDVTTQHVITLTFLNPKNSYIGIEQSPLNSDGSYSVNVEAVELWLTFEGDYIVTACNGKDRCAATTFTFVLSEPEEVIEEEVIEGEAIEVMLDEELADGCGEGTHLENGVCMLGETPEPTSVRSTPASGFNAFAYSVVFTVAIAFGIMIILYAISRSSRTKTA